MKKTSQRDRLHRKISKYLCLIADARSDAANQITLAVYYVNRKKNRQADISEEFECIESLL